MGKSTLLSFVLLACGFSLWAQSDSQSGKPADPNTLTGCLSRADNWYILTDDIGTAHRLVGSNKQLAHQLGHQIEVTGKPGTRTQDATLAGGASTAIERQVFEVKTIKQIADTCQ